MDIERDKESTTKTNGKATAVPMRWSHGKRYTDYDKQDLAILADVRLWLNANGLQRKPLADAERRRRVEEYARQVAESGTITAWLPPPDQRGLRRYARLPVKPPQWRGFAY